MRFDAIIFDLDGTLLNTLDDIADSANNILARRGFPTHPVEDYRYFVGDGVQKLIERVLPAEARKAGLAGQCLQEMREEYGRNWNVKTRPYDDVPEMLDELAARGLKLAVLSNKPDELTKLCVGELLRDWTFDVVAGHGPGFPHKPDPTGALEVARRLGVRPERIVFLGDSGIDMRTAVAAGMYPVGVLWGYRTIEELMENGARALLEQPDRLIELVDSDES
jgi:phosphoglycolate phosphatase